MTKELKEFLLQNRELIETENYYKLYCAANNHFEQKSASFTKELSELLIECDVNPLEHLLTVPTAYLANSDLIDHIVIPDNIEVVERAAFLGSELKSVTFNDTSKCTVITNYAFDYCEYLETVILPPSCTTIGNNAFAYCGRLKSIVIPSTASNMFIHDLAFTATPDVKIYCKPGYVEDYCINNNIEYELL